jgi:hypothetical protein
LVRDVAPAGPGAAIWPLTLRRLVPAHALPSPRTAIVDASMHLLEHYHRTGEFLVH